jgi:hypothetical protein
MSKLDFGDGLLVEFAVRVLEDRGYGVFPPGIGCGQLYRVASPEKPPTLNIETERGLGFAEIPSIPPKPKSSTDEEIMHLRFVKQVLRGRLDDMLAENKRLETENADIRRRLTDLSNLHFSLDSVKKISDLEAENARLKAYAKCDIEDLKKRLNHLELKNGLGGFEVKESKNG